MDKKNEKTIKKEEMMELTLDQMDKVSGGVINEFFEFYCDQCDYQFVTDNNKLPCPNCGNTHVKLVRW